MLRKYIWPLIALVAAAAVTVWYLTTVNIPILEPKGPVAAGELNIIILTVVLCAIVVIPVFFMLFYFAWKYREDNPHTQHLHTPNWDHTSALAELIWWVVPSIIIVILSIVAWNASKTLDPYVPLVGSEPTTTVDVVALDWKWLFIYPQQGIATVNLLEIPENSPVHFYITSDAPINSFWIPQLGGQIMAMAGMQTQLNLEANSLGTFNGYSANISGEGFAGMNFTVKSVSEQQFQSWIAAAKQSNNVLNGSSYQALAKPSEYNPISYYSSIDPNLYINVIMNYMMPANSTTTSASSTPIEITPTSSKSTFEAMPDMNMNQ